LGKLSATDIRIEIERETANRRELFHDSLKDIYFAAKKIHR